MDLAVPIILSVVVVWLLYSVIRKPKAVKPDPAAADSRLAPPAKPQGGGGPLNPEK